MSLEEHKRHTFDAYCKRLLRNEAINIRIEYARRSMAVEVKDAELAGALAALSEERRTIILLSYLLGMTDPEIARQLNLNRSTVQLRRTSILKELRKLMEGFTYEQ